MIERIAGWHINNSRYKPTPAGTLISIRCAGFKVTEERVVYPTTVIADIRYTALLGTVIKVASSSGGVKPLEVARR